jgi:hypothetical protein
MLLNGYFDNDPFTAEIYIRETDRIKIRAEKVHIPIPTPTRNLFSGCKKQIKKYINALPITAIESLKFVSGFIQDCIDNPEPDCFVLGGHRHIAVLNSGGFSWVDEPKKPAVSVR